MFVGTGKGATPPEKNTSSTAETCRGTGTRPARRNALQTAPVPEQVVKVVSLRALVLGDTRFVLHKKYIVQARLSTGRAFVRRVGARPADGVVAGETLFGGLVGVKASRACERASALEEVAVLAAGTEC